MVRELVKKDRYLYYSGKHSLPQIPYIADVLKWLSNKPNEPELKTWKRYAPNCIKNIKLLATVIDQEITNNNPTNLKLLIAYAIIVLTPPLAQNNTETGYQEALAFYNSL